MRLKSALVALAAAAGVLATATPSNALPCPRPFQSQPTRVGVVWVSMCVLYLDAQP